MIPTNIPRIVCLSILSLTFFSFVTVAESADSKPNILIITVDDMSADSLGAFGCKLQDTSPTIDSFAKRAMKFNHAHVHVGNCMPGRNIMWSGMFSHVNGVEGFRQNKDVKHPVLCDLAKQAGYFTGIRGKVSHSTPYAPYAWDAVLDTDAKGKKYHIKDAASYGESMRSGIQQAEKAGKPFCLMMNISDPHKPFYAQGKGGKTIPDKHVPSRVFKGDEVPIPGFLHDDAVIRKELAHYYSSVRRADDCFKQIMIALDEWGGGNTFILFLSDHGMPLPFAKTQLYYHSTHTPLMVAWAGVTKPGSVDNQHVVGAVDLIPTLMDVMGSKHPTPEKLHGRSFAPILRGETQQDRDYAILQYNENAGGNRHPMRGIQTRDFLYIHSPWSDGKRVFATATTGTETYRQMVKRAEKESYVRERLQLYRHRVLQELYDVKNDPDCLVNLIDAKEHQETVRSLRSTLAKELAEMNDPAAPLVAAVDDSELRNAYMAKEDAWTAAYKKAKQAKNTQKKQNAKKKQNGNQQNEKPARVRGAIKLQVPKKVKLGETCVATIRHNLPKELGQQKVHVTLKKAAADSKNTAGARVHREVITVEGTGEFEVSFKVPNDLGDKVLRVAAFVGEDFQSSLQHVNSKVIDVE